MNILCLIFGHNLRWRRVPIGWSPLCNKPAHERPTKLRGECDRCPYWTTAIPPEVAGPNPSRYPHLAKFVDRHRAPTDLMDI